MWWSALGCGPEPAVPVDASAPQSPLDSASPPVTTPWEPDDPEPTEPVPVDPRDPFWLGDPARLAGIVTLGWKLGFPDEWFVTGVTFVPGSAGWTGTLDQPLEAAEGCELRVDDPRLEARYVDTGDLDLLDGTDHVLTERVSRGNYVASTEVARVPPTGRQWDVISSEPFSAWVDAIGFAEPLGSVDAPAADSAFDPASPLAVRWSGGSPGDYVQLDLLQVERHAWARCRLVDDGAYDVDPALLARLPPGPYELALFRLRAAAVVRDDGTWLQLFALQGDQFPVERL